MRKISLILFLALLLAACTGTPTPVLVVPTLAVLPSATPFAYLDAFAAGDLTLSPSPAPSST